MSETNEGQEGPTNHATCRDCSLSIEADDFRTAQHLVKAHFNETSHTMDWEAYDNTEQITKTVVQCNECNITESESPLVEAERGFETIYESVACDTTDDAHRLVGKHVREWGHNDITSSDEVFEEPVPVEYGMKPGEERPQEVRDLPDRYDTIRNMKGMIEYLNEDYDHGVPVEVVRQTVAWHFDMTRSEVTHEIDKLKQKGEAYTPKNGTLKTT